jgi:proteasome assembly chaperone (PAC2) family protein
MTEPIRYLSQPKFNNPALLVCWESDAGQLGEKVVDYLTRELDGKAFCEINPIDFFPLGGVTIEKDVVLFPESTFYSIPDRDLVVLYSTIPRYEWAKFFNLLMDVALETCHAREIFTIGGMVAMGAHTAPRDCWATFNSPQIKRSLSDYQLSREMDYETPPGARPTLNSFLLWSAQQRGLHGATLWVPVPFYLVSSDDPTAQKKVLEFLDSRLNLRLNFARIDAEIIRQNERLARMCQEQPEIERIIKKLEGNLALSETENETLIKEVEECLGKS